jgi:hypothetical protein
MNLLDNPKDVALPGYQLLIKDEHRVYGEVKVKLFPMKLLLKLRGFSWKKRNDIL